MFSLFRIKKKTNQAKRLTQKDIISQIEEIRPGETASYRLTGASGNNLATVEFNTGYPWSGRKYILSTRPTATTGWAWERDQVLTTNEAREIATWLIEHRVKRRLQRRMVLPNNISYRTAIKSQEEYSKH